MIRDVNVWAAQASTQRQAHVCNCIGCCRRCGTCRTWPGHTRGYCDLLVKHARERAQLLSEAPSHTSHDPRALAQAAPSGVGQAQPLAGIVTSRDGAGTDIGDRSGERQ